MQKERLIKENYEDRLNEVLNESWKIFKSQFIYGRHIIEKEAPFQHHFAQILNNVGNLYSVKDKDLFKVELEAKCEEKYIDITCEFLNKINCAIELKFKTKKQGAQDHGKIDLYTDIKALENATENSFNFGKFYMITNSTSYTNESKSKKDKTVAKIFSTYDGYMYQKNKELTSNSKGRENISINLRNSYKFEWEKIKNWYFLELTICK